MKIDITRDSFSCTQLHMEAQEILAIIKFHMGKDTKVDRIVMAKKGDVNSSYIIKSNRGEFEI